MSFSKAGASRDLQVLSESRCHFFPIRVKYESCFPIQFQDSQVSLRAVEFLPQTLMGIRDIISTVNSVEFTGVTCTIKVNGNFLYVCRIASYRSYLENKK